MLVTAVLYQSHVRQSLLDKLTHSSSACFDEQLYQQFITAVVGFFIQSEDFAKILSVSCVTEVKNKAILSSVVYLLSVVVFASL